MSLNNYDNLKTAIASWVLRPGDTDVLNNADDFIGLCEADLFQRLRLRSMEYRDTAFAVTTEYTALPTGFLEFRKIKNTSAPYQDLSLVDSSFIAAKYGDGTPGLPLYYAIEGNQLRIAPVGSVTLDITYWKKFDGLSVSVSSNDVLANYPKLYLYGCLKYAAPFVGDDPMKWEPAFEKALTEANRNENRGRYSGSAIEMRARRAP